MTHRAGPLVPIMQVQRGSSRSMPNTKRQHQNNTNQAMIADGMIKQCLTTLAQARSSTCMSSMTVTTSPVRMITSTSMMIAMAMVKEEPSRHKTTPWWAGSKGTSSWQAVQVALQYPPPMLHQWWPASCGRCHHLQLAMLSPSGGQRQRASASASATTWPAGRTMSAWSLPHAPSWKASVPRPECMRSCGRASLPFERRTRRNFSQADPAAQLRVPLGGWIRSRI